MLDDEQIIADIRTHGVGTRFVLPHDPIRFVLLKDEGLVYLGGVGGVVDAAGKAMLDKLK